MRAPWATFPSQSDRKVARARRAGPRGHPVAATLVAAVAVAGLLAGCRNDQPKRPQLDVVWLQRQLTGELRRQTRVVAVEHMACPVIEPRRGATLECSAAFNAEPDIVVVTLLEGGPRPRHRARLKNLLLGALEGALQRSLARSGYPLGSVDCPGPVPQRRGTVSRCNVEDRRGGEAQIRVVQIDDRGRVRFSPLRAGRR